MYIYVQGFSYICYFYLFYLFGSIQRACWRFLQHLDSVSGTYTLLYISVYIFVHFNSFGLASCTVVAIRERRFCCHYLRLAALRSTG